MPSKSLKELSWDFFFLLFIHTRQNGFSYLSPFSVRGAMTLGVAKSTTIRFHFFNRSNFGIVWLYSGQEKERCPNVSFYTKDELVLNYCVFVCKYNVTVPVKFNQNFFEEK